MVELMERPITILYFAWVKERLGRGEETVNCPDSVKTVAQLIDYLKTFGPVYEDIFTAPEKLRFALDQDFVKLDASIAGAKELAIFPPVTGG